MSGKQLYVNKPGGVVVHLADGSQKTLRYGAPVPDDLAEHQRAYVGRFADDQPRSETPSDTADTRARVAQAHLNSAVAHPGPNSSVDVVPADYAALDTDGAVALMNALHDYPEAQAQLVLHEKLNYGRDKVLDAATPKAKASAGFLLDQMTEAVKAQHLNAENREDDGDDGQGKKSGAKKSGGKDTPPPSS